MTSHFPSPDIGMFGRRQRHARGHRIPVTIVRSAETPELDAATVRDTFGPNDTMLLHNGCPCCTVRLELQGVLRQLLAARGQRHFTRIMIETSEESGPILRTFATPHALGDEFYVEGDLPAGVGTNRFVLTEESPLSWDAFSRFVTTLQALRGADLLHVKCVLNVVGCRGPAVVQIIQHLCHPPVELQAWPDGSRASRLEFITRNIDERAARGMFDAVRALA